MRLLPHRRPRRESLIPARLADTLGVASLFLLLGVALHLPL